MYLCIGLTLVDIDFNQNRLNLAKEVEEWDTNDKKLSKPKLYRLKQILSCIPRCITTAWLVLKFSRYCTKELWWHQIGHNVRMKPANSIQIWIFRWNLSFFLCSNNCKMQNLGLQIENVRNACTHPLFRQGYLFDLKLLM